MPDVEARGVRFHVQTTGRGAPAVVLIHGFVIDNSSSHYFMVAPALSPYRRVVCYDLRGHGLSEAPPTGYTLEDAVLDLEAVLDEVGERGRRVGLVGTSMGGRVALEFALRLPERVESVALLDSELSDEEGRLPDLAETVRQGPAAFEERVRQGWEQFLEEHRLPDGSLDSEASAMKSWVESKRDLRRKAKLGATLYRLLWSTSFLDDLLATPPVDWERLAHLERPVLALYGERSEMLPTGRRLAETLPRCTLEVLPDCGHSVIFRTDAVGDALRRWFADPAAGSTAAAR